MFVITMSEQRVARAEVHRGHAEGAEPSHVGPAVLRPGLLADGRHEGRGRRVVQPGSSTAGGVLHLKVESGEDAAQVLLGLGDAPVWSEPVVRR